MEKLYETKRLVLKTLDDTNDKAKQVLDYFKRNHDHLKPWEPLREEDFYTLESRRNAMTWEKNAMKNASYLRLWVYKKEDTNNEKIIGTIGFKKIMKGISCNIGYSIDLEEVRKGYITEALKKATEMAFTEYDLNRIEATIMPSNIPSIKVVEKLGFKQMKTIKDYLKINGKWEDHILMSLTNN